MPNPPKPVELKALQGNPGRRPILENEVVSVDFGAASAPEGLGPSGLSLWATVYEAGELWVSSRTDVHLVEQVCRQMDRVAGLRELWLADPADRGVNTSLLETEKAVQSGLSLLGFTPADRTRLGLVSARAKSKLEEIMAMKRPESE
jgi:hypothetical protein